MIFQNRFLSQLQTHPTLVANAATYARDASSLVQIIATMSTDNPDRLDLIRSYADALKVVWIVMCALAGVAMIASAWTEGLGLDRELGTEQGFVRERRVSSEEEGDDK